MHSGPPPSISWPTLSTCDSGAFLDRHCLRVLGRSPDQPGLRYWTGQLDGGVGRQGVLAQLIELAEPKHITATS